MIVGMGADAIDPLEPPPHGDVTLDDVRQRYGRQLVLFGNLEVVDIERMDPARVRYAGLPNLAAGNGRPRARLRAHALGQPDRQDRRAQHAAQLPDHRAPRHDLGAESRRVDPRDDARRAN